MCPNAISTVGVYNPVPLIAERDEGHRSVEGQSNAGSHLTNMIRTTLFFAAAATLIPAAAHAQAPCSLLTPDQIKAVVSVPVNPGTPGGTKDSPDCAWKDAKGQYQPPRLRHRRGPFHWPDNIRPVN